jgi:hypothetical protein
MSFFPDEEFSDSVNSKPIVTIITISAFSNLLLQPKDERFASYVIALNYMGVASRRTCGGYAVSKSVAHKLFRLLEQYGVIYEEIVIAPNPRVIRRLEF